MSSPGPTIAEIKDRLQARTLELARQLAPGGHVNGGRYFPRNPTRNDRSPGSFVIWLTGPAAGAWKDYATDDSGDILDLIGYCQGIAEPRDIIAWAKDWAGLAPGAYRGEAAPRRPAQPAREADDGTEKRIARARAEWLKARPGLAGTVAETYLASRGLAIGDLARVPAALRFNPSCWYDHERSFPAIVACMQASNGGQHGIVAVHRTYLSPDGRGKAPVRPARKMLGQAKGAIIAVARGLSDMPVREANEAGIADTLVLTEGIEDALTVALSAPECRVWAVGSLGNLAEVTLPRCCADLVIFADNDWGKPEAQAALARAIDTLARSRVPIRVARSTVGKDANDLLRGGNHAA